MKPRTLLAALLVVLIAGVCLVVFTASVSGQPSAYWVVTGRLVKSDGSPLAGIDVGVYEASARGHSVKVGAGGVILNLIVETDAAGRFSIQVKRALFTGNRFMVLASIGGGWQSLVDSKGAEVVLDVHDSAAAVPRGDITAK